MNFGFRRGISLLFLIILFKIVIAQEIFVVSDVYGIRPDGTCHELVSGDFGYFKQRNGHWDAASKTVKIYAAKNEEVAVQIVIPKTGKGFWGKMSILEGASQINADRANFSTIAWINHVEMGMCPDLVIPLDGSINQIEQFDIPITFQGTPNPENSVGVLLFEVWVPKNVNSGQYKGTLSIMQMETEIEKLNVELSVFDFALPDMPNLAFELLSYGMPSEDFNAKSYINSESGLGKPANAVPELTKKIDYQVYKLAFDHRCFINTILYHSQRGKPQYAYPVKGVGADAQIMNFREWDDYFDPILEGKINKFSEPPQHFMLPFNINYPYNCEGNPARQFDFYPYKKTIPEKQGIELSLKDFEDSFYSIAGQYIDHFAQKGWTKTRFEVYFNQKPNKERNRSPWKLDEPTSLNDYKGLRYLFNVSEWAFESSEGKDIQVVTRLDIGHFNCDRFKTVDGNSTRCGNSKGYNRDNADLYLKNTVDHWVIGTYHLNRAQNTLKEYEAPGKKLMNYSTTGTSEAIGLHYGFFAGEGYKSARIGIEGRILYKLGLNSANPNKQETSSYKGNTFYNGMSLGFKGALPSHRLKLWRNAVNDFDYIALAKIKDKEATKEIINKMVKIGPSSSRKKNPANRSMAFWFNNNVEDILIAKLKMAEIITGQNISDTHIRGFSEDYTPCGSADKIVGYD